MGTKKAWWDWTSEEGWMLRGPVNKKFLNGVRFRGGGVHF